MKQGTADRDVLNRLRGGNRRSVGKSNQVAATVLSHSKLFRRLLDGMWDEDPVVRMRAADAAEKVSSRRPQLLQPFKKELLGLLADAQQQELRWHLAQMIPRLNLTTDETTRVSGFLDSYLGDRSSIVKTFVMQALADLAATHPERLPDTVELLQQLTRSGTPAMRARGRKLLAQLARTSHEAAKPTNGPAGKSRRS